MASTTRALLAPLLALVLLPACEPFGEPEDPSDAHKPCASDADCEIHSHTRYSLCGARKNARGGNMRDIDAAACGPMANMASNAPEPALACFRGTCMAASSKGPP